MRGYKVTTDGRASLIDIKDSLDEFYREIGCGTIDITRRSVMGNTFHVVVDDIGLLRENPVVTVVDGSLRASLVGTVLIFGFDGPEFRSLTDDEVEDLRHRTFDYDGRDILITD